MTSTPAPSKTTSIVNRTPVYYGWFILLIAIVGMCSTMPGQTPGIGLFIDRWIADFGLEDRSTISALYLAGTFIASLSLKFVGNYIDRFGNRVVGVVIVGLFALALVYMSFVQNLTMLLIGFILIRALGQGSLGLVSTTAVANWFMQLRGLTIAMTLLGFSLFQRWYLPMVQRLLENNAWEQVWLMLAAGLVLITLPLMFFFMRYKPELFEQTPAQEMRLFNSVRSKLPAVLQPDPNKNMEDVVEVNYTFGEALRLPIFWVFLFGSMMAPMFGTGIFFHQQSLFGVQGIDAVTAATATGNAIGVGGLLAIPAGILIDRVRPSVAMALQLGALSAAMVLANFVSAGWTLTLWAVFMGMSMGIGMVFGSTVWPNLFGRLHQGSIRGFVSMVSVTATAMGPFALALSYDAYGDYRVSLFIGAGVCFIPLVLSLFMTQPRPHDEVATAAAAD